MKPTLHPTLAKWRTLHAAAADAMPSNPTPQFEGSNFTKDWFTGRDTWPYYLGSEREKVFSYLEIGSFEGMSARFAAKFFPNARLTCIDTFSGGGGMNESMAKLVDGLEARFRRNIEPIRDRVDVLVGTSTKQLAALSEQVDTFDVIFIDGAHYYRNVLIDTAISWPLLKTGGIMIWDDYFNAPPHYGKKFPNLAINQFLDAFEGDFEPIFAATQVAVRKVKAEPPIF